MPRRVLTDRQILEDIHEHYQGAFQVFPFDEANRENKMYVPIDIEKIAARLGADVNSIFGRLYYHLNQKYGYQLVGDNRRVAFFTPVAGADKNCIQFPLLESVLASMRSEHSRFVVATSMAGGSLLISAVLAALKLLGE